ncbi:MAG: 2Fe-2S iron-sulfur cluster binding domain-containing protein [Mesorhizobium sp.]|nr:MAG: 2Fe-2S iron-sulfur cluster binding domain-containing protein [Mesorhizobium sp.]
MDAATRLFIENSTLLFIASRNAEGAMDVSPRGGQPTVLKLNEAGTLLLPDYSGNRRLDTVGNILANPRVALIILNRGSDCFLRVMADAEVSFLAEDLSRFPADENQPVSVLAFTPRTLEFVTSRAFERADFWIDPSRRRPPLDLGAVINEDKAARAAEGYLPIPRNAAEEGDLIASGVREVYGPLMEGVDQKVSGIAGPGALRFMEEAIFTVLAHENAEGEIELDVAAEAPLSVIQFDNRYAYRLRLPGETAAHDEGECALLTIVPGQNELLRVNGRFEREPGAVKIAPHEVFFHCSAALSRSRIWQQDRRSFWSGKRRFTCTERHRESPEVTSFVLKPCDKAPIGPVLPGQYITVSLPDETGVYRQRSYSVSRRADGQSLRISVRRTGAGRVSDLMHDAIEPGMELLIGVPAGRFVLSSPPERPIVLASAGVGITPLLPMLDELAREDSGREVLFIHAARDGTHHLFEDEARSITARAANGGIRLFTCYSRPRESDRCDLIGRLDADTLARLLPMADADFYLCGPDTFMTSLRDGLVVRGALPDSIRFEAFETSSGFSFDLSGKNVVCNSNVTFAKSGKSAVWSPGEGSLLDLALRNDVNVAYSCRQGDCQSCVQKVVSGVVDYPGGEEPLLSFGQTLLCLAVPRGDLVLDC